MAQYCLKAEDYLTVIPNDMSYDNASMGCCALGPSFTALELMSAGPFDTVLISGLGPVGLGAIINARFKGVRNIIGVDSHPYRAELAKKLGANIVIDPTQEDALQQIMEYTKGKGVDKSVETSGRAESKKLLLDVLRAKGQSALIGWGGTLDVNTIISKGLIIHGVWHYNLINANKIIEVINSSKELLDILITHKFPLSKIQDAWEIQCSGNCGKVLLHPWEE
jgi:threonine dehydrogenase-like Zn-dependent dehydrogenase